MQYWWVTLIVAAALVAEIFAVYLLRYKRASSLIIVLAIAIFVMGYKTYEFAGYRIKGIAEYPIEFSHISYFIFGSVVILGLPRLYSLAGYCATLTGLGNMIALIASPDSMVTGFRSVEYFILSVVLHNLMLFGGMLLLCNSNRFKMKDVWITFVAIAAICGFAQLVNAGLVYGDITYKDNIILLKIMDGRILEYVVDPQKLTTAIKVVGTVCIFLAVSATVFLYTFANNRIYDSKLRKLQEAGKQLYGGDIGIVPLVMYGVKKCRSKKASHE